MLMEATLVGAPIFYGYNLTEELEGQGSVSAPLPCSKNALCTCGPALIGQHLKRLNSWPKQSAIRFYPFLNLPTWNNAVNVINDLTIPKKDGRRDGTNAKLCAQVSVLFDVHPVNFYFRIGLIGPLHEAAENLHTARPFCKKNGDDQTAFTAVQPAG
jgi:hypothetical protein